MNKLEEKFLKSKHPLLTVVIALLIFIVLLDLTPLGGNWKLYANWIRCGQKPMATNLKWEVGGGSISSYGEPPLFAIFRTSEYYCTAHEAEKNGFSASSYRYQFPHLTPEEAIRVMDKKFSN